MRYAAEGFGDVSEGDYMAVVADYLDLTPDEVVEMNDSRDAYEAEFSPVDLSTIPASDPFGCADEWAALDDGSDEAVCVSCGAPDYDPSVMLCGECLCGDGVA